MLKGFGIKHIVTSPIVIYSINLNICVIIRSARVRIIMNYIFTPWI